MRPRSTWGAGCIAGSGDDMRNRSDEDIELGRVLQQGPLWVVIKNLGSGDF